MRVWLDDEPENKPVMMNPRFSIMDTLTQDAYFCELWELARKPEVAEKNVNSHPDSVYHTPKKEGNIYPLVMTYIAIEIGYF